jgi:predicted DNA-binding helix-hairpin-helix protein
MGQIQTRKDELDEDRRRIHSTPKFAPAGQSTQMVVGATASTDREIMQRADGLYRQYGLRRIYYTGFSPYPKADLRLPLAATPMVREHRLYQADWLIRFYGFNATEITTPENPHLDLTADPKTQWARRHPEFFPIDVNSAPRETLLRVPGLGYRNVDRILSIRRYHRIILEDLRRLHVSLKSVSPWIVTANSLPVSPAVNTPPAEQLTLELVPNDPSTVSSTLNGQL